MITSVDGAQRCFVAENPLCLNSLSFGAEAQTCSADSRSFARHALICSFLSLATACVSSGEGPRPSYSTLEPVRSSQPLNTVFPAGNLASALNPPQATDSTLAAVRELMQPAPQPVTDQSNGVFGAIGDSLSNWAESSIRTFTDPTELGAWGLRQGYRQLVREAKRSYEEEFGPGSFDEYRDELRQSSAAGFAPQYSPSRGFYSDLPPADPRDIRYTGENEDRRIFVHNYPLLPTPEFNSRSVSFRYTSLNGDDLLHGKIPIGGRLTIAVDERCNFELVGRWHPDGGDFAAFAFIWRF